MEESCDSSSNSSEAEESDAEQSGDDNHDDGSQSGDEGGKSNDAAELLDANQLFGSVSSPGVNDGNAKEAEQSPSQGTADGATNAPLSPA